MSLKERLNSLNKLVANNFVINLSLKLALDAKLFCANSQSDWLMQLDITVFTNQTDCLYKYIPHQWPTKIYVPVVYEKYISDI